MSAPRWLIDPDLIRPRGVADDAIVRVLRVPPECAGLRLDVFLSGALRNTSRTRAKLIAENGAFGPEGKPRKASERLRAEDRIVLWRRPVDDPDTELELPVIYEDEHLLVIDKPPNIAVHPTARHHNGTVTKRLEQLYPGQRLHLIHRLDRETSGVLLIARGPEADRAFKMAFEGLPPPDPGLEPRRRRPRARLTPPVRQRLVEKYYLAICWGAPPDGEVNLPLESDPDNPLRVKMRLSKPGEGLTARTTFESLARCDGYSLVRCVLLTGRQHQIRVHLASLGCPVVGDKLYGPDDRLLARGADGLLSEDDLTLLELPRHALHASCYRLSHAVTGQTLELRAPLAADLADFWRSVAGSEPPNA